MSLIPFAPFRYLGCAILGLCFDGEKSLRMNKALVGELAAFEIGTIQRTAKVS